MLTRRRSRSHPSPAAAAAQKCDIKELNTCKASLKTSDTSLRQAERSPG